MGHTKNGDELVVPSAEQIGSGYRYPYSVGKDTSTGVPHWINVLQVVLGVLFIAWIIIGGYVKFYHGGAPYSFEKNVVFKNHMKTNEYGINYYVRSRGRFDKKYPVGTLARAKFEKDHVIKDYIEMEQEKCKEESESKFYYVAQESFPACDKLRDMGLNPYPKD